MNDTSADLRAIGDVDPVTRHELRRLAAWDRGPCVSIYLPTHRFRPDIGEDPLRLRGLLDDAHARLCALGLRSPHAWEVLAPHRELLGRLDFWLHQSFGLALFAAPGFHRRFRVCCSTRRSRWAAGSACGSSCRSPPATSSSRSCP
ncbi:MAG: hypothetical protein ACKO04_03440 [Actinomycetes bacterium]